MKDNESLENNRDMSDLLLSEERLKMVLEGSEQGFWDWNLETDEVKRNDRADCDEVPLFHHQRRWPEERH